MYRMFPEIKFDFLIYVLGTGMHIECDVDLDTMFRKYAKNPYILISVYERVDPIKILHQGETDREFVPNLFGVDNQAENVNEADMSQMHLNIHELLGLENQAKNDNEAYMPQMPLLHLKLMKLLK